MAIYLDHNATTALHPKVREAMLPYMAAPCGNPSSLHSFGRTQRDAIEQARAKVAQLVDAHPSQIIFTSGGTEANNLLITGFCASPGVKRIAVSAVEHASVLKPAETVAETGCALDIIAVDSEGLVSTDLLQQTITEDTALVSIMAANNETGVIQNIKQLVAVAKEVAGKMARDKNIFFHTDAAQLAGKSAISFRDSGVHAMTLSAHKLYGPMGVGALVIDKRLPLTPLLRGGAHENNLRAGTENVPAIVGFGEAAAIASSDLVQYNEHVRGLRDNLQHGLDKMADVVTFARNTERLPNTVQFGVHGFDGETLLMQLDRKGFAVSSGSACNSGKTEPSHVLSAMQVPVDLATSAIRVSFGKDNTMADVKALLNALTEITALKQSSVMMAATV